MLPFLKYTTYSVLFLLLLSLPSKAQTVDLYNAISNDVRTLHSRVLHEDRRMYIHVPKADPANPNRRFPVLYLLDGENHFHILSAYVDYLSHWGVIPPMIVVGIINNARGRDLTPTKSMVTYDGKVDSSYKMTGGNESFFRFIKVELIPYIEKNFKVEPYRVFAGHSFGGITTLNGLFTQPDMFDAYIAVSPSLWWDNKYILKLAEKKLTKSARLNKKLFYSAGNEGINEPGSFHTDVVKFDSLVVHQAPKDLSYTYKSYPEETHMTEPIVAYYEALRFIYRNWKPPVKK